MVQRTDDSARQGDEAQALSALMDGALRGSEADAACALWRHSAEARADWHAWHLIGDVLRSDDLAARPARDAAFLQALRGRLAQEPVPLAPASLITASGEAVEASQPAVLQVANGAPVAAAGAPLVASAASAPVSRRGRLRLVAPMAVAAGFVAVVGVMVMLGSPTGSTGGPTIATAPAGGGVGPAVGGAAGAGQVVPAAATVPVVVRDPVLDAYLSAHRSQVLGVPPAANGLHRVLSVNERP